MLTTQPGRSERPPDLPATEAARLSALAAYDLSHTSLEAAFDRITALASSAPGTSAAPVSLVVAAKPFFGSRFGLELCETDQRAAAAAGRVGGHTCTKPTTWVRQETDGRITPCNPAAERILGLSEAHRVVGQLFG